MEGFTDETKALWRPVQHGEYAGLECLVLRRVPQNGPLEWHPGWYCGYVRLPDGVTFTYDPAFYPVDLDENAFGGMTYVGTPCHADGGTWVGFDTRQYIRNNDGTEVIINEVSLGEALSLTQDFAKDVARWLEHRESGHKPCPFCGEKSVAVYDDLDSYRATCYGCGCVGPEADTFEDAWERWNERANLPITKDSER